MLSVPLNSGNILPVEWNYAGIDGCRAGWFCVFLDHGDGWGYALAPDVDALAQAIGRVSTALIDIPIGLLDRGNEERRCDIEARRLVGRPRSSSVFAVPARPALMAGSYSEGADINERLTGRRLSRQSWAIVPKISEVDDLLDQCPDLRGVLRECHPEVCFCMLNRARAMSANKKEARGREERLAILGRFFAAADTLFEEAASRYSRREVALDDIVDAMAAAITAWCGHGVYKTLPANPIADSRGQPMEIVYREPDRGSESPTSAGTAVMETRTRS